MRILSTYFITLALLLAQLDCFAQNIKLENKKQNIIRQETFKLSSSEPEEQKREISQYIKDQNLPEEKIQIVETDRCRPDKIESDKKRRDHSTGANLNFSGGGSSDEFAIILIVIIGSIVVITWLASFPALLFKGLEDRDCILFKQQFFIEFQDYRFDNYYQDGSSYALQYSIYLKHKFENSIYYGMNVVYGQHNFNYGSQDETTNTIDRYFLIGPSLLFPFYSATSAEDEYGFAFHLDFLLGKSYSNAIDGMTQARFGLQYSNPSHLLFGFGIAGNKLNIDSNDGYYKNNSDFSVSYFFKFGLEF